MTDRQKLAGELFAKGYNCSQSIAVCFCDVLHMDEKMAARLASGFGGGIGRLREVCGGFCAISFVLGAVLGYDDEKDNEGKKQLYKLIQTAADQFRAENGFLRCRDLLGLPSDELISSDPEKRTVEYYKRRPCKEIVEQSAGILEKILIEKNIL